jgi:hypothetical protein
MINEATGRICEEAHIVSKPSQVVSEPPRVISEPPRVISEPPRIISEPPRIVSKPSQVVSKPYKIYRKLEFKPKIWINSLTTVVWFDFILDNLPHGGVFPVTGGVFPGHGGVFPVTGEVFPGIGEVFPGIGGVFPVTGGVFPGIGGVFPGIGGVFPVTDGVFAPLLVLARNEAPESSLEFKCGRDPACLPRCISTSLANWQAGLQRAELVLFSAGRQQLTLINCTYHCSLFLIQLSAFQIYTL